MTSRLSSSLRISDCILRITGTNTSCHIHINCDSYRIAIWQIVGPFVLIFRYFESQRRDQPRPYEKRNPLSCRVIATQAVTTFGHKKFTRLQPSTLFHVTNTHTHACVAWNLVLSGHRILFPWRRCSVDKTVSPPLPHWNVNAAL